MAEARKNNTAAPKAIAPSATRWRRGPKYRRSMQATLVAPSRVLQRTPFRMALPGQAVSRAAQRGALLGHPLGHRALRAAPPRTRVEGALALGSVEGVDHRGVLTDVLGQPRGERVLHLGVDVDLDDAVDDRLAHLLGRRAAGAVEAVVEARAGMRAGQGLLARGQDLGPQLDV